ncbi:hypothetical protein CRG98_028377 [Punica granatum]|uniref:Uncharacterized protein n=1 Tax=Punica granatum TaxID=22663 RepID=A0A2I0J4T0_PUNGR|nr:hypothetical protein CRG98_028377 [Punica granatum]
MGYPDPSTEVAGTHEGRRRSWWRGRGHRLVAPTPNRLGTFESKGRQLAAPNSIRLGTSDLESLVDSGLGPPIGDPNRSSEVAGVLRGCRRPRWIAN